MRKQNGFTLISLVVTIIILIILAGVSASLLLGENGIITKAKQLSKQQKIAEITDKLELYKADLDIEDLGKLALERYLEKLLNENVVLQSDIQETGKENSKYITVEGEYVFLVEKEENGNIKIEYLGIATEISPQITKITPTTTGYEIKVVVETIYNKDGDYKYCIKETSTDTYEESETLKNSEYTFENLKPGVEYDIKVIVTNNRNLTAEKEIKVATIEGTATYYIDTDNIQTQSFAYGASVLDTSFTPTKDDYIFIGWREDTSAEGDVLTQKTMQNKEITLYAVFGKEVSVSYDANGGDSTPATQIDYIYYNNGNEVNPTFTLAAAISRSGYAFQSWNLESIDGTAYDASSSVSLSSSTTFYAEWKIQYTEVKNAYVSGWCHLTGKDGINIWPYSPASDGNSGYGNYARSTIASNGCISWYGNYFRFKANVDCKVTITTSITAQPVDGSTWYAYWYAVYVDGSQKTVLYNGGVSGNCDTASTNISKTYTINLTAGQICDLRFRGGHDQNNGDRTGYSGACYVSATPI